jgi:hypothetical protein
VRISRSISKLHFHKNALLILLTISPIYDLPFEMDDPTDPEGDGEYTTKRLMIAEYEHWVQEQMDRVTAELDAMLKSTESENAA